MFVCLFVFIFNLTKQMISSYPILAIMYAYLTPCVKNDADVKLLIYFVYLLYNRNILGF